MSSLSSSEPQQAAVHHVRCHIFVDGTERICSNFISLDAESWGAAPPPVFPLDPFLIPTVLGPHPIQIVVDYYGMDLLAGGSCTGDRQSGRFSAPKHRGINVTLRGRPVSRSGTSQLIYSVSPHAHRSMEPVIRSKQLVLLTSHH